MSLAERKPAMGVFVPAEWAAHKCIWVAFPSHEDMWLDDLAPAQEETAAMVAALAQGDKVKLLVVGDAAKKRAEDLLGANGNVDIIAAKFGDVWVRDTGPIFLSDGKALRFQNNGWGGKYDMPEDHTIGDDILALAGKQAVSHDYILEGGAVDQDGEGTLLTTAQCLLNPNRNKTWTKEIAERELCNAFGASRVVWINEGLLNDHTDGHIDNIARFIASGKVVCMKPFGADDPNAQTYADIAKALQDAGLEVVQIPSPGRIENEDGDALAASHLNFIIGNETVVMPTYGTDSAEEAVRELQKLFPDRKVVGLSSGAILRNGGGSFHCMSQQEPL